MIVHINHISQSKKPKGNQRSPQSELASLVTGSSDVPRGRGRPRRAAGPSLRIHLDWIQYKTNFRDPVIVRRTTNPQGQPLPLAEIAIDLRQADAARLPDELAQAVKNIGAGPEANGDNHVYLDDFKPYRDCLIWAFNRLFWRQLGDWEAHVGQGIRGGAARRHLRRQSSAGRPRLGGRLLDAAARPREPQPAAGGDLRPGDRRRLRRARGGLARSVQGARRAVRHQLLLAPALPARRLLADEARTRAAGGGASRRARAAGSRSTR